MPRYVLPEHLWIPITDDAEDVDKPEGVLHVKILNATGVRQRGGLIGRNGGSGWCRVLGYAFVPCLTKGCLCSQVPRMDLLGGCDPYLE